MKNNENLRIFQMFQFCSIWGVVSRQLEATSRRLWAVQRRLGDVLGGLRGVLEASWRVLEASWKCFGGVLGASWTCLGKNIEKRLSALTMLQVFWEPTYFSNIFFVIFHVFESQLVKTRSRRILAKHWLGAQKSRFA